ncbi:MAG: hypothetical protein Q4C49_01465 [Bacillota bacterium]|nr:hypothetical protein [Bacillota bacterium]
MEMIVADNNVYEDYSAWLFKKEACRKKAYQVRIEYLHVFGSLIEEKYRWKCACKYLQKSIQYKKERLGKQEIESRIEKEMEMEFREWTSLCEEIENAKQIPYVSKMQQDEIQGLFFQISQKLQDKEELWEKAERAYLENDIETLRKLKQSLMDKKRDMKSSLMEYETRRFQKEVKEIHTKEIRPYTYVLSSVDTIQNQSKYLQEEITSYKYLHKRLKKQYYMA